MQTYDVLYDPKNEREQALFGIDISKLLSAGETVTSAAIDLTVILGRTHVTSTMLVGSIQVSGTYVTQMIKGGIGGNEYRIRFSIVTSLGQNLIVTAHLVVTSDAPLDPCKEDARQVFATVSPEGAAHEATSPQAFSP